jgi:nicotinamidase-related amidase
MTMHFTPRASKTPRRFPRRPAIAVLVTLLMSVSVPAGTETPQKLDAKTALLIIDVQEFYFPGGLMPLAHPGAASRNCGKLLQKFRDEHRLVVHVGHNASKQRAFHSDVAPAEGEKVVIKDEVNAFNGTDLLAYLREKGVERLVICGMQTHMCVEAAVRAAYDLGFECVLVDDACATRALTFGDVTVDAADVHNSTLATLDGVYATIVDTDTFLAKY